MASEFDRAGTLKEMQQYFDLTFTEFDRVLIAKQAKNIWRFVWQDDSGRWSYTGLYRTRRDLLDALPQFMATTFEESESMIPHGANVSFRLDGQQRQFGRIRGNYLDDEGRYTVVVGTRMYHLLPREITVECD